MKVLLWIMSIALLFLSGYHFLTGVFDHDTFYLVLAIIEYRFGVKFLDALEDVYRHE